MWAGNTYFSQCFSTAAVESIIVPSISKRKPWKEARTGGAEKLIVIIGTMDNTELIKKFGS